MDSDGPASRGGGTHVELPPNNAAIAKILTSQGVEAFSVTKIFLQALLSVCWSSNAGGRMV